MKNMRRIGSWAALLGTVYGLWLGGNVYATTADTRNGLVIIALCTVILMQLHAGMKEQEAGSEKQKETKL